MPRLLVSDNSLPELTGRFNFIDICTLKCFDWLIPLETGENFFPSKYSKMNEKTQLMDFKDILWCHILVLLFSKKKDSLERDLAAALF